MRGRHCDLVTLVLVLGLEVWQTPSVVASVLSWCIHHCSNVSALLPWSVLLPWRQRDCIAMAATWVYCYHGSNVSVLPWQQRECIVTMAATWVYCYHGSNVSVLLPWQQRECIVTMAAMWVYCYHGSNESVLLPWKQYGLLSVEGRNQLVGFCIAMSLYNNYIIQFSLGVWVM